MKNKIIRVLCLTLCLVMLLQLGGFATVNLMASGQPEVLSASFLDADGNTVSGNSYVVDAGTIGYLRITVGAYGADLTDGKITISNYLKPATISTTIGESSYVASTSASSGIGVFEISLKTIPAGATVTFTLPFNQQDNVNHSDYIKGNVSIGLTGTLGTSISETTVMSIEYKYKSFNDMLSISGFYYNSLYRSADGTKYKIDSYFPIYIDNFRKYERYESIIITWKLPAIQGKYPTEVAQSYGMYGYDSTRSSEVYNPSTGIYTVTYLPSDGHGLSHSLYSTGQDYSYAYFYAYATYEGINPSQSVSASLKVNATAKITPYKYSGYSPLSSTFTWSGASDAFNPQNASVFSSSSGLTSNDGLDGSYFNVPIALSNDCFKGYTSQNFNYYMGESTSSTGTMETRLSKMEYVNTGSPTYNEIPAEQVTLTELYLSSFSVASGSANDVTVEVWQISTGEKIGELKMTSTATRTIGNKNDGENSVVSGYDYNDLQFVFSEPVSHFNIYVYFELNSTFIAALNDVERIGGTGQLGNLRTTWQPNIRQNDAAETSIVTSPLSSARSFKYEDSMMSHTFTATNAKPISNNITTNDYTIKFPYNSTGNVKNPVFYVVFPKEVIIAGIAATASVSDNLYNEFNVSYYPLSDGRTAVKFEGNRTYPRTSQNGYTIGFSAFIKAPAGFTLNGTYTINSYSFSEQELYGNYSNSGIYGTTTINRDYLDGLVTTANKSCYYYNGSLTLGKVDGIYLQVNTVANGSAYAEENLAPVDAGSEYMFNVQFGNNSEYTDHDIKILVRLPYAGNAALDGTSLNSTAETHLTSLLSLPEDIRSAGGKIYYTSAATPGIDVRQDGWTETPDDITAIRNVLVDFGSYVIREYSAIDFMCFPMKVSSDAELGQTARGVARVSTYKTAITSATGLYVPSYTVSIKNLVVDSQEKSLSGTNVLRNPDFAYILTNEDTESDIAFSVIKASGTATISNLPAGTYSICRDEMISVASPYFKINNATVNLPLSINAATALNGMNVDIYNTQNPVYSVSYGGNGATDASAPADDNSYFAGETASILGHGTLEKTGYSFKNWNTEISGDGETYAPDDEMLITGSVVLYAQWKSNTYEISFDSNGGSECEDIPVTFDDAYGTLPAPTKDGYTFRGWYSDDALYNPVTSGNIVATPSNHTLYAKWDANDYAVSFESNGGSECEDITVTFDDAYGTLPAPTKNGYTFLGWYSDEAFTKRVTAASIVATPANHTLHAKWDANGYTASFDSNGGSECDDISVTFDSAYGTLLAPTKTGYTFRGWFADAELTEPVTSVTFVTTPSNHTLYAKWEASGYAVSFESNGGSEREDISVTFDSAYGTLPAPTKDGYTFRGWYSDEAFTKPVVAATIVATPANHTLHAKWDANGYTVSFVSNGGSECEDISVVFGDAYGTLPAPTKIGYTFRGWYSDSELTKPVTSASIVANPSNHTLHAKWEANAYAVSFESNGGGECSNLAVTFDEPYGALPLPTRTGYSFSGWYLDEQFTKLITATTIMKTSSSHTLYAKWTPNDYLITYIYNGADDGNEAASNTVVFDAEYGSLPTPTRTGYIFLGWYLDADFAELIIPETVVSTPKSHKLYAKWVAAVYIVSFENCGDDAPDEITVIFDEPYGELPTPNKSGYSFSGWFLDEEFTIPIDEDSIVQTAECHALYAKWTYIPVQPDKHEYHEAYLTGYADGSFRPYNFMTRAEAVTCLLRTLSLDSENTSTEPVFIDVESSAWYSEYVNLAFELGLIFGYGDGTFCPDKHISAHEFVLMATRAGYKIESELEVLEFVTRVETVVLMNQMLGRKNKGIILPAKFEAMPFTDVSIEDEYYNEIIEAAVPHYFVSKDGKEIWQSSDKSNAPRL